MKPFRERSPISVGLISVLVLTILMGFAFSLNRFTFIRGVYPVNADFSDASGLTPDNEVRIAGLKVGKVKSVDLIAPDAHGVKDRVRVVMEINNGIDLGSETEGEIKLKTILGAKFIDLTPKGGAPYIRGNHVIPLSRTRIPFEIYQVTNRTVQTVGTIDAKELNNGLRELATLFDDPNGNLGRALDGLSKSTKGLKDRDAELQLLVKDGGTIIQALGSRSQALGRIFDSGAALLQALAARGDALGRFVDGSDQLGKELGDFLKDNRSQLDPALRDLHTTLLTVKKDIAPLEKAVQALGPSAHSFGAAFLQGHWGDIWLQTVLDLPIPPIAPGGTNTGASATAAALTTSTRLPAKSPVASLASLLTGATS